MEPDLDCTSGGSVMVNLGKITLNISFILYLVLYLPQLWRNIKYKHIKDLSFGFHALLFIAATADLYYGFGRIEQWQYRAVSIVMFACLLTQHIQLFFYQEKLKLIILSVIIIFMLTGLLYVIHSGTTHTQLYLAMGWIERTGYWLYLLPQIIKNRSQFILKKNSFDTPLKNDASRAISPVFVSIGLLTAILDSVSAWSLSWASPSLYGAPIAVLLHIWILGQCFSAKGSKQLLIIDNS